MHIAETDKDYGRMKELITKSVVRQSKHTILKVVGKRECYNRVGTTTLRRCNYVTATSLGRSRISSRNVAGTLLLPEKCSPF